MNDLTFHAVIAGYCDSDFLSYDSSIHRRVGSGNYRRTSWEDFTMTRIGCVGSVTLVLLLPMSAFAHGFGWARSNMVNYYCPVVVCVDPCLMYVPMVPQMIPGPQPRQAPLAAPSGAPPSSGPIQSDKGKPEVTESRSYYEAFNVRPMSSDKPSG